MHGLKSVIFAITCGLVSLTPSFAYSAIIEVEPGSGTLRAAIAAAEDGDTLLLAGGAYSDASSSALSINKSLTLKGIGRDNKPTISIEEIDIVGSSSSAGGQIVLHNLAFQNTEITIENRSQPLNTIALLENQFASSVFTYTTSSSLKSTARLLAVGNTFDMRTADERIDFGNNIAELVFAGNVITASARPAQASGSSVAMRYRSYFTSGMCNITGNRFLVSGAVTNNTSNTSIHYQSSGIYLSCDSSRIFANRFILDQSQAVVSGDTLSTVSRYTDRRTAAIFAADGTHDFQNNLFKINTAPDSQYNTQAAVTAIALNISDEAASGTQLLNNVFDWSDNSEALAGETLSYELIDSLGAIKLENNIFYNTANVPVYDGGTSNLSSLQNYNMCFGSTTGCFDPEQNNVEIDPNFTDTQNYVLSSASPAINTGNPDPFQSDVDGSRNDLGIYGGAWPYDQYQDQIDDDTQPFVYPLLDANESIQGDALAVRILSVARAQ